MEKLVVCIMGQNCERYIGTCLEAVKDADAIVYCDGDSEQDFWNTYDLECRRIGVQPYIIQQFYDQEDKAMNGKQRNFYLKYLKENYPNHWALCLDADEVVENLSKIREFIDRAPKGLYAPRMRHFIGDLGHEDANQEIHWVLNRLFKIDCAGSYPEVEHPVLQANQDCANAGTDCTTIWHLAYIPNLFEIKRRYENHLKKSNMHTPEFLKKWYLTHLLGQYPRKEFPVLQIPPLVFKMFGIEYDELYFYFHSTLEAKHFVMLKQWVDEYQKRFKAYENEHPTILDIGCGIGLYGQAATILGYGYTGFELSKWAVEHSAIPINQGDICTLPKMREFDLILVIDVLEHLEEERLDEALSNLVNRGSMTIFSIPFLGDPNLELDPTHKIKKDKKWWIQKLSKYFKISEAPSGWAFANQILVGVNNE